MKKKKKRVKKDIFSTKDPDKDPVGYFKDIMSWPYKELEKTFIKIGKI